jgi:hypothetical protein
MRGRNRYPSDLSDERWALIEPVITAWKAARPSASGHQGANGADCVETGRTPARFFVRDTQQHGRGPLLTVAPAAWSAFLATVK